MFKSGRAALLLHPSVRLPQLRRFFLTLLLAVMASGLGCDRNIEPYVPGESARAPDLARIFPGPPSDAASAGNLADNGRAPDRTALPPSRAEGSATGAVTTRAAAPIEGTIVLSAESALTRPPGAVLFLIARPQGVSGGPPLAVLRVADPEFPYAFRIGPENVMIPSMRFEGAIALSARLDADGNAMTRSAEDISTAVISSLAPGARGVKLVLTRPH
jgi:hypothetical protein